MEWLEISDKSDLLPKERYKNEGKYLKGWSESCYDVWFGGGGGIEGVKDEIVKVFIRSDHKKNKFMNVYFRGTCKFKDKLEAKY